jgi:hypothetical protein
MLRFTGQANSTRHRRTRKTLGVAAFLATLCACGPSLSGSLTAAGFKHHTHDYGLSADPSTGLVLPSDWQLESAVTDGPGLRPRQGEGYDALLYFDVNGDGQADTADRVPLFDLRYVHRTLGSRLWLSTAVLPLALRNASLDQAVEHFLAGVRASGTQAPNLGLGGPQTPQPTTVRVLMRAHGTLAGREARQVKLEIAPSVAPGNAAPASSVGVIGFVRPGSFHLVSAPGREAVAFPVLLVIGYESSGPGFDAGLADYENVLARLSLAGRFGSEFAWLDSAGQRVVGPGTVLDGEALQRARAPGDAFLEGEELQVESSGDSPGLAFDRAAATQALGEATSRARSCREVAPEIGAGHGLVRIVFSPSGYVQSATLEGDGAHLAGTAVGSCVLSAFRMAAVPLFETGAVSVVKRFVVD